MNLIIVLMALGCLQIWGETSPFHRDAWFFKWSNWVAKRQVVGTDHWLYAVLVIAAPCVITALGATYLPNYLAYPLALIVLLYALGRGEFASHLRAYTYACDENAWANALEAAQLQGVEVADMAEGDWSALNLRVLEVIAYQGFERLFAVIFWFVFFGPGGALLYRLSYLFNEKHAEPFARQWLWGLEWPAVRLLSVSFAITGNFVGCINRWRRHLFSQATSSQQILRETVLGALSVDDELVQSCDCTQREVAALRRLYARTLWFWVSALAIWTILY